MVFSSVTICFLIFFSSPKQWTLLEANTKGSHKGFGVITRLSELKCFLFHCNNPTITLSITY